MIVSGESIVRPANASGISLRLLQKSNCQTVAKLLLDAELDEGVKRILKAFTDEGLKIHGVYVHNLDTKVVTVNDLLGLRLSQKVNPTVLRKLRTELEVNGITINRPEADNHYTQFVNVFFNGKNKS